MNASHANRFHRKLCKKSREDAEGHTGRVVGDHILRFIPSFVRARRVKELVPFPGEPRWGPDRVFTIKMIVLISSFNVSGLVQQLHVIRNRCRIDALDQQLLMCYTTPKLAFLKLLKDLAAKVHISFHFRTPIGDVSA